LYETVGEDIVTLKLGIAPDPRLPSEQLGETDLESPMEIGDPTFVALDQRLVVYMGVADEDIVLELHSSSSLRACHAFT
jgi:hypothetical protein